MIERYYKVNKHRVESLRKSHVKELVALAKSHGFKAYMMPCMQYGCAQPGLAHFVVDWGSFGGNLPEKLAGQRAITTACREARLAYFDREE